MDFVARNRARDWKASGAPEDKARAMQEAIRNGKLDPRMVQLCAFLGEPACSLIGEGVKPTGVIIRGHLVRNGSISELIDGLGYFGKQAILRINLALARMAFGHRTGKDKGGTFFNSVLRYWNNNGSCLIPNIYTNRGNSNLIDISGSNFSVLEWFNNAEKAINGNKESLKYLKRLIPTSRNFNYVSYNLPVLVLNIVHESILVERPRPKALKFCNGYFEDETIISYMRREIFPWALGEFSDVITEPFKTYFPFTPTP